MKKEKKQSITLMVVAIITLLTLIIGATYAYFQASGNSGSGTDVNVVTATSDLLTFKIDKDINIIVGQSDFKKGAGNKSDSTKASAILTASNSKNIESTSDRYNIYFIIEANDFIYTTDNATAEILLNVTDPNGNKVENITGLVHTDKGFDITTRTGGFLLVPDYDITATRGNITTQEWKVEVTLVNLDTDQTKNTGKTLSGKLFITKEKMSSYELTKITNVETETTYNSIKTTLQVANGTSPIEKYYYGIEKISSDATGYANNNSLKRLAFNDVNLIESDKPTYTFKNLEDNATYKIYSYGIDKNKIKTNMYETEVTTNSYNVAKINSVTHTSTLNSITLNVNAQKGDNEIEKYFYSKDNGETYIESTSSTYTFDNLTDTTEYKIKVKVLDSYGRYSTEYLEAIATTTYILPSVTKVTPTTKYNQITVTTTGTKGTNEISKYYYSINNSSYVEGTSTYTFTNINEQTTYTIKVKVADTKGRMSNEYSLSATTDAYKLPTITDVTTSSTYNSITINVSGQNGDGAITEYYYSKDDGSNYIKSTNSSYTFTNLTPSANFFVKVYVKDKNEKTSSVFTTSIATVQSLVSDFCTNGDTLSDCIIKYANQGPEISKIYVHNSSLANGANDNSYRFSGGEDNACYYNGELVKFENENFSNSDITPNTCKNIYQKNGKKYMSSGIVGDLTDEYDTVIWDSTNNKCVTSKNKIDVYSELNYTASETECAGTAIIGTTGAILGTKVGAGTYVKNYINNYVCFGSDASPCPEDNLYRIIGVFGDNNHGVTGQSLVKLVKATYAKSTLLGTNGNYDSDNKYCYNGDLSISGTSNYSNEWPQSALNTINLNTNLVNNIGNTWANKIQSVKWKINANVYKEKTKTPSEMYNAEVSSNTNIYDAKIGLIYASDYGFGTSTKSWTKNMYDSEDFNSVSEYGGYVPNPNWFYNIESIVDGHPFGYTITSSGDGTFDMPYVLAFYLMGEVSTEVTATSYPIHPSFYLTTSTKYISGSGTQSDPIIIN